MKTKYELINELMDFVISEERYETAMWSVGNDEAAEAAAYRIKEAQRKIKLLEE